jgi:hypothetical protein
LNKSVNSLKLIDEVIRIKGERLNLLSYKNSLNYKTFFALTVYIGEVIVKAIDGEWRISAEKSRLGNGNQYRWMIRISNSQGRELGGFIDHIQQQLWEYSYPGCRFHGLVKSYIREDRNQDDSTWRDFNRLKPDWEGRIWKNELEDLNKYKGMNIVTNARYFSW